MPSSERFHDHLPGFPDAFKTTLFCKTHTYEEMPSAYWATVHSSALSVSLASWVRAAKKSHTHTSEISSEHEAGVFQGIVHLDLRVYSVYTIGSSVV